MSVQRAGTDTGALRELEVFPLVDASRLSELERMSALGAGTASSREDDRWGSTYAQATSSEPSSRRSTRGSALVLAGDLDMITPPRYGRVVADAIPGARFEILADEAHQPFQEAPGLFNAKVDAFWRAVEVRGLEVRGL